MCAQHISCLETILKHDNSIEEISLCFVAKKLSFNIPTFNEQSNNYDNFSIEFNNIRNIYFSQINFINNINIDYGLEILTCNTTKLEDKNYKLQLLIHCNYGEQDLEITFNFSPAEITIAALN